MRPGLIEPLLVKLPEVPPQSVVSVVLASMPQRNNIVTTVPFVLSFFIEAFYTIGDPGTQRRTRFKRTAQIAACQARSQAS